MKSFKPRQVPGDDHGGDDRRDGGRNAAADFKGEKRANATHASTTDPDAMQYARDRAWRLGCASLGHGLMENRSGPNVGARHSRVVGHAARLARARLIAPMASGRRR